METNKSGKGLCYLEPDRVSFKGTQVTIGSLWENMAQNLSKIKEEQEACEERTMLNFKR